VDRSVTGGELGGDRLAAVRAHQQEEMLRPLPVVRNGAVVRLAHRGHQTGHERAIEQRRITRAAEDPRRADMGGGAAESAQRSQPLARIGHHVVPELRIAGAFTVGADDHAPDLWRQTVPHMLDERPAMQQLQRLFHVTHAMTATAAEDHAGNLGRFGPHGARRAHMPAVSRRRGHWDGAARPP
jgi:hypothetical protein